MTEDVEQLKEQLEKLGTQVEDWNHDVVSRIETIEHEQSQLDQGINTILNTIQEQGEQTPHIRTVESLYQHLQQLEENMAQMRESVEEMVE